jgi:hypothetical protein
MRKAMLEADEYDPIAVACGLPPWEAFKQPRKDGRRRILGVRVDKRGSEAKPVSLVTHIKRPRDGVWECIEGQFEGPKMTRRFKWLNEDGTTINIDSNIQLRRELSPAEYRMWMYWDQTKEAQLVKWRREDGSFIELSKEDFSALEKDGRDQTLYRIARHRAGLNPFIFD